MNVQKSLSLNNSINLKKSEKKNAVEDAKKSAMSALFKTVRCTLPDDGEFEPITQQIDTSNPDDTYFLYVQRGFDKDRPQEINLRLLYKNINSKNSSNINLVKGTKQDITDFLGNEKNLELISYYMDYLKTDDE